MSFMYCMGVCFQCKTPFSFNPNLVPSLSILNGKPVPAGTEGAIKEPFCQSCLDRANADPRRKAMGLPPLVALPGAYEPEQIDEPFTFELEEGPGHFEEDVAGEVGCPVCGDPHCDSTSHEYAEEISDEVDRD